MLSLELAVTLFIRPLALLADSPKHCIVTREQAREWRGVPRTARFAPLRRAPVRLLFRAAPHGTLAGANAQLACVAQLARLFANLETIATIHAVLLRRAPPRRVACAREAVRVTCARAHLPVGHSRRQLSQLGGPKAAHLTGREHGARFVACSTLVWADAAPLRVEHVRARVCCRAGLHGRLLPVACRLFVSVAGSCRRASTVGRPSRRRSPMCSARSRRS